MAAARMLLLLFVMMLLPESKAISTEDVHALTSKINTLTSSTWDIIEKFKHISKHTVNFIRVSTPVGSLIAAAAEIAYPPESEEFQAIKKLHEYVSAKFGGLSRLVQHLAHEIKLFLVANDYQEKITDPLNAIEPIFSAVSNPYGNRTAYKNKFISYCQGYQTSPHNILLILKSRLYSNCPLPGLDETDNYAITYELFFKLEKNHIKNFSISFEQYETIKGSLLSKSELIRERLTKIVNSNASSAQVEKALENLHKKTEGAERPCWLQVVMDGNKWKRHELTSFAELVRLDLLKTTIFGTMCANISYAPSEYNIEMELKRVETLLREISAHVAEWIQAKLEITWPIISTSFAKEAVGDLPVEQSTEKYNAVAQNVKKKLDKIGPANFFHNVLVFPDWSDNRQRCSICPQHYCVIVNAVNQINFAFIRYRDNEFERAVRANKWFTLASPQMKIITSYWLLFNNTQPLVTLQDKLTESVQRFGDPNLFPHVILLHNWNFVLAAANITYGDTITTIRGFFTTKIFQNYYDPLWGFLS
uniref:Uncharacterized protein n=1 Tax=Globodera rostochiensis TaxID=31243 RepID=A0A914IE98_GLORO